MKYLKRILLILFPIIFLFFIFLEFGGKYLLSQSEKIMIGWNMNIGKKLPADFNNFYNTVYLNSLNRNSWDVLVGKAIGSGKDCPCNQTSYSVYPHTEIKTKPLIKYILVVRYLENSYTQRQCLNYNLNNFNFLEHGSGIDQASKSLFNKEVKNLQPLEMAEILALYENPVKNNRNRNPEKAKSRAGYFYHLYLKNLNSKN